MSERHGLFQALAYPSTAPQVPLPKAIIPTPIGESQPQGISGNVGLVLGKLLVLPSIYLSVLVLSWKASKPFSSGCQLMSPYDGQLARNLVSYVPPTP